MVPIFARAKDRAGR